MSENVIVLSSARQRLVDAAELLEACDGIATTGRALDTPLATYLKGVEHPAGSILHRLPSGWTVGQAIDRAADEARHGAQEAVDEIAHAQGWPR